LGGAIETLGILRCAQDDGRNLQQQLSGICSGNGNGNGNGNSHTRLLRIRDAKIETWRLGVPKCMRSRSVRKEVGFKEANCY
jgi:hypothetical protein